jgi:hypothetical protein
VFVFVVVAYACQIDNGTIEQKRTMTIGAKIIGICRILTLFVSSGWHIALRVCQY